MRFIYQARNQSGEHQTGIVEASSREAAFEVLKSHGLFVTSIAMEIVPVYAKKIKFLSGVPQKEIIYFSREVAIMFKSKVPLIEIFQTVAKNTKNPNLRDIIMKISESVEGGKTLSDSLEAYPNIFPPFYVNMVRAGEASGKLSEIFIYLAAYLEKEAKFRGKLLGAFLYPGFIFCVFVVVIYVISIMVIPNLAEFLKSNDAPIPWITQVVISFAEFIRTKGYLILIGGALLGGGIYFAIKKSEKVKNAINDFVLRIPVLNTFLKKVYLARFALNLSTLISGGLPIVKSLEITADVVGNPIYKKIILKTMEEVKKGEKMSNVLMSYPQFVSPLFYQMILVGEKTGTIESTLVNVVDFYQEETDRALENFTKLLEPIMMIILGVVVGGLIGAVLIPMYTSLGSMSQ